MIEFAEEELDCSLVIVSFSKTRSETREFPLPHACLARVLTPHLSLSSYLSILHTTETLMRMFTFLGFVLLPPKHPLVPLDAPEDLVFMAYDSNGGV